ncbi:MAG: hypothetical protein ACR2QA_10875 [Solirubrobacteraceae bacterium]
MRAVVFTVSLLFIALLGVMTVRDFVRNGVTGLGVVSTAIVVLFAIGIVGALRHPPDE